MAKAIITNRIYMHCEEGSELAAKLSKELTYKLSREPISPYPLVIRNLTRISRDKVSIPSGRVDLIPEDYEIVDRRVEVPLEIPEPSFTLRGNQQEAVDYIEESGIINAKVGWGKTIAGLGLIHKLGQKALIVTTTTTIRDMWAQEIEKFFGVPAGIIGSGKFNTDAPICVGNIQTLRNHVEKVAHLFGTVVFDEVHRTPATTFTGVLNGCKAKHKIGLSGTLERKDGLHVIIPDYFSDRLFKANVENTVEPKIHLWETDVPLNSNPNVPWAEKVTALINNPRYREQVLALSSAYAAAGHKVLVLCDRVELLEWGHSVTEDFSLLITGKVTGHETRSAILKEMGDPDSTAKILWGTQSIFSEGVSVNALSCVILATPISNDPLLEQICGRVMRQAEGKLTPIVCDLGLAGPTANRQRNVRTKFYLNQGWELEYHDKI